MKLCLHVGTPKTGTTAIRGVLQDNGDWLAERGVHVLRANTTDGPFAKHRLDWKNPRDPGWTLWREEIAALPAHIHTVVISNEGLFALSATEIRNIRNCFKKLDIDVLAYVREQAAFLQSYALYQFKPGRDQKPYDLRSTDLVDHFRNMTLRDYFELGRRFESGVGAASRFGPKRRFRARLFDRSRLKGGDAALDFLDALGIDDPAGCRIRDNANLSLTAEIGTLLHTKREALESRHPWPQVQQLARELSRTGVGSKYFLTRAQVEAIRAEFADSNRAFAERYLENADGFIEKPIWVDQPLAEIESIEAKLHQALDWAPPLPARWAGRRDLGERIFSSGWRDRTPNQKTLRPTPAAEESVVRFYVRRPSAGAENVFARKLQIEFDLRNGDSYAPEVTLNGAPLGPISIGERPIEVDVDDIGPLGEVELRLSNPEDMKPPPVVRALSCAFL